jgi:hypothetical protein
METLWTVLAIVLRISIIANEQNYASTSKFVVATYPDSLNLHEEQLHLHCSGGDTLLLEV